MKRSSNLIRTQTLVALSIITIIWGGGCATQQPRSVGKSSRGPAPCPARISHIVFMKLKDPAQTTECLRACDRSLASIPGVVAYAAGTHLDTGRGESVDSNYDIGIYIGFANEADYGGYVDHPDHVALVTEWKPRLEWLRVSDVVDITP